MSPETRAAMEACQHAWARVTQYQVALAAAFAEEEPTAVRADGNAPVVAAPTGERLSSSADVEADACTCERCR